MLSSIGISSSHLKKSLFQIIQKIDIHIFIVVPKKHSTKNTLDNNHCIISFSGLPSFLTPMLSLQSPNNSYKFFSIKFILVNIIVRLSVPYSRMYGFLCICEVFNFSLNWVTSWGADIALPLLEISIFPSISLQILDVILSHLLPHYHVSAWMMCGPSPRLPFYQWLGLVNFLVPLTMLMASSFCLFTLLIE